MSDLRLHDYLMHILTAITNVQEYVEDIGESGFLTHKLVQDAVIRNLEIIGEACNNIQKKFPEITQKYPEVPWRYAYEMRNILSHGYFAVDLEVVWKTIENDLPALQKSILDVVGGI